MLTGGDPVLEGRVWRKREDFRRIENFSRFLAPGFSLRAYQEPAATAVLKSVIARDGRQFAVMFSRQSGKDELLAQTVAYLLWHFQRDGGSIVLAAPTFHPQAALMRDRLHSRLNGIAQGPPVRLKQGYRAIRRGVRTVSFGVAASEPARADRESDAGGK